MQIDLEKWLWLDLEMTGLDPAKDRIIEAAAIVTDTKLSELANWHRLIHQPEDILDYMKDAPWYEYDAATGTRRRSGTVYEQDEKSGLLDNIRRDGADENDVVKELVQFIADNFDGQAILAGSSIHQDRRFIRQWWPQVEAKLHYQMIDVSSFKLVLRAQKGVELEKRKVHRALDDVRESIAEFRYCLDQLKT